MLIWIHTVATIVSEMPLCSESRVGTLSHRVSIQFKHMDKCSLLKPQALCSKSIYCTFTVTLFYRIKQYYIILLIIFHYILKRVRLIVVLIKAIPGATVHWGSELTTDFTSACTQIEVNDHLVSLGVMSGQHVECLNRCWLSRLELPL